MLNIKNKLNILLQSIENDIQAINSQLSYLPPGDISFSKNGNYLKWFTSSGSTENKAKSYLPKKDHSLIPAYIQKKYLLAKLKDLLSIKKDISNLIKQPSELDIFLSNQIYSKLVSKLSTSVPNSTIPFANEPFERNTSHPENLIYKCTSGNIVRSKSEVFIDQALHSKGLSYRYEAKVILDEIAIYPDFTIIHPYSNKTIYWEHFGMMDNIGYAKSATRKIELYCSNNIIPGDNLILSFESRGNPFNQIAAEKIVNQYLI